MFKIKDIKLEKTVFDLKKLIDEEQKQIAFAGRSNVGKSSLLNLIFSKKIAKVSSTPGKTRSINYYLVNGEYFFVDLPGYGFARVSSEEKVKWQKLLETYFINNTNLEMLFLLIDSRHILLENDRQMVEWIIHLGVPLAVILTKTDKLNCTQLAQAVEKIKKELLPFGDFGIFPVSVLKKKGVNELSVFLEEVLK